MNKSCSSSSVLNNHKGILPKLIQKYDSSSLLEKSNDSSSELNNDSSDNDCDSDESSSNSNNNSSSNCSSLEDSDLNVNSYQFEIDCNHKNEMHEYSRNPMLYYILNDIYTHDPEISLNEEYYSKAYDRRSTRSHLRMLYLIVTFFSLPPTGSLLIFRLLFVV